MGVGKRLMPTNNQQNSSLSQRGSLATSRRGMWPSQACSKKIAGWGRASPFTWNPTEGGALSRPQRGSWGLMTQPSFIGRTRERCCGGSNPRHQFRLHALRRPRRQRRSIPCESRLPPFHGHSCRPARRPDTLRGWGATVLLPRAAPRRGARPGPFGWRFFGIATPRWVSQAGLRRGAECMRLTLAARCGASSSLYPLLVLLLFPGLLRLSGPPPLRSLAGFAVPPTLPRFFAAAVAGPQLARRRRRRRVAYRGCI